MQETVRPYAKGDSVRISDLPESAQKQIEMLRNDFTEQAKGPLAARERSEMSVTLLRFFITCYICFMLSLSILYHYVIPKNESNRTRFGV